MRERLRFLVGDRVRVLCDVEWTDVDGNPRFTRGPSFGQVVTVDDQDHTTIFGILLDSGGEFPFEEKTDGRVVERS